MDKARESAGYRGLVLAMLLLVYTFNFIDRQILSILVIPIKAEMGLSDRQVGLLLGPAFALLYTVLAIPIALVADRRSRSAIIAVSLAVWSLFTALCGMAGGFVQLMLFRLGVGIGEAGGVAPTYALIPDFFPKPLRARALAIYSLGVPIGSALGTLLGGWIAGAVDWRWAFVCVGVAGLVLAPIFRLIVREPIRGRYDTPAAADGTGDTAAMAAAADRAVPPSLGTVLRHIRTKPSFWLLAFGASCSSMVGYGMLGWTSSYFARTYHLTLGQTGEIIGGLLLVGGTVGVLAGGWLGDRLGSARPAAYALVPAVCYLVATPFYVTGLLSPNLAVAIVLFLIPTGLTLVWLGPVTTAVQHLVPPSMRATASASFLLINNLIGLGLGPLLIGTISTGLTARYGTDALRYAILSMQAFYLAAALLMGLAARHLKRDWHG